MATICRQQLRTENCQVLCGRFCLNVFVHLLPGRLRRFTLVQKHTVEFNQVAMANSEGSEVMLNRVMTKDNIGVAVLLEVNKDMFSGGKNRRSVEDVKIRILVTADVRENLEM